MEMEIFVAVIDWLSGLNIYVLPETVFVIRPADIVMNTSGNPSWGDYKGPVTEIVLVRGPITASVNVRGSTDEIKDKF